MLKKIFTVSLLSLLFLQPALSAQNKFREPSVDQSLWLNQFTVLLAEDADAKKTIKAIEKTIAKDFKNISVGAFKKYHPASISTILPMLESTKQKSSSLAAESAREKLGRYLIVNYPGELDIEAIFTELKADPDVLYVAISEAIPLAVSAAPSSSGAGGLLICT